MKTVILTAIILMLINLPVGILAAENRPGVIQIDSGPISGNIDGGVRIFLGIPYAAPPVGELRWKPPQQVASWTQVRSAADFGPSCPQPNQKETVKFSEDCLCLNVWTPAEKPDDRMPVMVWIYVKEHTS